MHPYADANEVSAELYLYGHHVKRIVNITKQGIRRLFLLCSLMNWNLSGNQRDQRL